MQRISVVWIQKLVKMFCLAEKDRAFKNSA
jgi:hypothetical protein